MTLSLSIQLPSEDMAVFTVISKKVGDRLEALGQGQPSMILGSGSFAIVSFEVSSEAAADTALEVLKDLGVLEHVQLSLGPNASEERIIWPRA